jgi:hypothetical protein
MVAVLVFVTVGCRFAGWAMESVVLCYKMVNGFALHSIEGICCSVGAQLLPVSDPTLPDSKRADCLSSYFTFLIMSACGCCCVACSAAAAVVGACALALLQL